MKGITKNLEKYRIDKSAANSKRADTVGQLMEFMGEEPIGNTKRFKYWLGRTGKLSPETIRDLIKEARKGKKPQALFNYLLKNHVKNN